MNRIVSQGYTFRTLKLLYAHARTAVESNYDTIFSDSSEML